MASSSVYLQIQDLIRAEIAAAMADGRTYRLPTEREIEARCQVSRPTVSKALAGLAAEGLLIKPDGCRRFVVAPVAAGRLGVPKAVQRIGFVAGDLTLTGTASSELVHRVFQGIDTAAQAQGLRVMMGSAGTTMASERATAHDLVSAGASGLVIWPCPRSAADLADDYLRSAELTVPVVLLDNALPEQGNTQVMFDNYRAGLNVTRWLLSQGHTRIALITMPEAVNHVPISARRRGYFQALSAAGISTDPALIRSVPVEHYMTSGADGQRDCELSVLLDAWLHLPHRPTAIIGLEDSTAMDVILLLRQQGLSVPDDITVVGYDNLEAGRRFHPLFPTTAPDFGRLGELACETLLDDIEGRRLDPRTYLLEVPLLVR